MAPRTVPQTHLLRILLVDDSNLVRRSLAESVRDEGHQVIEAVNGEDALRSLEHMRIPDAIIMDIHMPVMDGIRATQILRARGLGTLPIFAFTARRLDPSVAASFSGFLNKPIGPAEVLHVIHSYLTSGARTVR